MKNEKMKNEKLEEHNMQPTLLILAAGMGSRYGGLKQIDQVGPSGEIIIDYAVYDAIRAGFNKVVFVIRRDIEEAFKQAIGSRYTGHINVAYAFQELNNLPSEFSIPEQREKPWGTGHAILAAKEVINEPFAVINGDDFYGRESFSLMGNYLRHAADKEQADYSMCGFMLRNTLSDHGTVSRGVCQVGADGNLEGVTEHTKLRRQNTTVESEQADGSVIHFTGDEIVSMNFWGFTPSIFEHLEQRFVAFLEAHGNELKSEFFIPSVVDALIKNNTASVKVMTSQDSWLGITYREDKSVVMDGIKRLVQAGVYPDSLF